MSERKKMQQVLWLDSKTSANLMNLYVRSGADSNMAYNTFLSMILQFFSLDDECIKKFLRNMYSVKPELKEYSMFIEKVEVEKPVPRDVFVCEGCYKPFHDVASLLKHKESCENVRKGGKRG
jgi:hypothetical protein